MTIVRDLNDEGHAILTVKTDRGEFVLDNLSHTFALGTLPATVMSNARPKTIRMSGSTWEA